MKLRTLPVLTRTLLLTTVAVGTLTPASVAVAGAVTAPQPAKTTHRGPVTDAEAFFTCAQDQQRFDRIQRIKHSIGQELVTMQASENQAGKTNDQSLVAYWKFDITQRQHYETYLLRYWHSDYDKRKKYEISVLNLHKKGDSISKGKARLKACKLTKLTFPPSKAAPTKPPASAPSTAPTTPASKKPPAAKTPASSSTTAPPASSTTTTAPASSSSTTPPASSTTTTAPAAKTTPTGSSTTVPPAPTTTAGT